MNEKEQLVNDLVNSWLKSFPGSSKEILTFIANILYAQGPNNAEIIRSLYAAGYCYYFALMLKDAFGGEMCWHKGYSHIVWRDTNTDTVYDIDGVFYDYWEGDIVPIDVLKADLECFRHRGKDTVVTEEMNAECKKRNISLEELEEQIYNIIPINERILPTPNKGDVRRYWNIFKEQL